MKASEPTLQHIFVQHLNEHTISTPYCGVKACTPVGAARIHVLDKGYSLVIDGLPTCLECIGRTVGVS